LACDLQTWLCRVREHVPIVDSLLLPSDTQQLEAGYYHTLREICQQPITWEATACTVVAKTPSLPRFFEDTLPNGPQAVEQFPVYAAQSTTKCSAS